MVRSVLYVPPRGGDHRAVVDFYRRHEVLGRATSLDGCLGSSLHVPAAGTGPLLVTALWESEPAYRRWLDDERRRELGDELAALLEGDHPPPAGELYRVVLEAGAEVAR